MIRLIIENDEYRLHVCDTPPRPKLFWDGTEGEPDWSMAQYSSVESLTLDCGVMSSPILTDPWGLE